MAEEGWGGGGAALTMATDTVMSAVSNVHWRRKANNRAAKQNVQTAFKRKYYLGCSSGISHLLNCKRDKHKGNRVRKK